MALRPATTMAFRTNGLASRITGIAVVLMVLVVLGKTYARFQYGVDLSDESLYVVMTHRLLSGARPFVDEINFAQTASILSLPVLAIKPGGVDGAVLWMRHGYFFFLCGVAFSLWWSLRFVFEWRLATVLSLWAIAFVPFNIFNFSYNTLGLGWFAIGSAIVFAVVHGAPKRLLVAAGISHGLAIAGRVALAGGVAAELILLAMLLAREERPRPWILYGLGLLPVAVAAVVLVFVVSGLDNVLASINYMKSLGAGSPTSDRLATSLLVLARLPFASPLTDPRTSLALVLAAGLVGMIPLLLRGGPPCKNTLLAIWLPSAIGGFLVALESTNGFVNAGVGFFPAAVFGFAFLVRPGAEIGARQLIPSTVVLGLLLASQDAVYRDAPLESLDTHVPKGAWAGIHTTRSKVALLEQLEVDLERIAHPMGRPSVMFYDRFPAGYLVAELPPAGNTGWLFQLDKRPRLQRGLLFAYFEDTGSLPDLIVRMRKIPHTESAPEILTYPPHDPIEQLVTMGPYALVLVKDHYSIFRRSRTALPVETTASSSASAE